MFVPSKKSLDMLGSIKRRAPDLDETDSTSGAPLAKRFDRYPKNFGGFRLAE